MGCPLREHQPWQKYYELMAKLRFSEEETKKVYCKTEMEDRVDVYEAWAVGKILSKENINKEASTMFSILCGLLRIL